MPASEIRSNVSDGSAISNNFQYEQVTYIAQL